MKNYLRTLISAFMVVSMVCFTGEVMASSRRPNLSDSNSGREGVSTYSGSRSGRQVGSERGNGSSHRGIDTNLRSKHSHHKGYGRGYYPGYSGQQQQQNGYGQQQQQQGGYYGGGYGQQQQQQGGYYGGGYGQQQQQQSGYYGGGYGQQQQQNGYYGGYGNGYYYPGQSYHSGYWRPVIPPSRPYRPIPRYRYCPTFPGNYRPYRRAPILNAIFGLRFGCSINVSLNNLYYKGYRPDGYDREKVYLRDVRYMGYKWDDAIIYFDRYDRMNHVSFYDSSNRYNPRRYDRLYRKLCREYGNPAVSQNSNGNFEVSWWDRYGEHFVTLSLSRQYSYGGYSRYYTTLTIGQCR